MSTKLVPVDLDSKPEANVKVIAEKRMTTTFYVSDGGTRAQIEDEIAFTLRSTELIWSDGSEGVNVTVISPDNKVWRPRQRFFTE
jgi:hypothetical protein